DQVVVGGVLVLRQQGEDEVGAGRDGDVLVRVVLAVARPPGHGDGEGDRGGTVVDDEHPGRLADADDLVVAGRGVQCERGALERGDLCSAYRAARAPRKWEPQGERGRSGGLRADGDLHHRHVQGWGERVVPQ